MSRRSRKKKKYWASKATVLHRKRLRRKYKVRGNVNRPQGVVAHSQPNTAYWSAPDEIPYSLNIMFLWSVRNRLPRKSGGIGFARKECNLFVPEHFSLVDNCNETSRFIFELFFILYKQTYQIVVIDYSKCQILDIDAQVLMDVLMKEFFDHHHACRKAGKLLRIKMIALDGFRREKIAKILYSVGSFKIHRQSDVQFPNLITYPLCIGSKAKSKDELAGAQKEIDVTKTVDYIQTSLALMHRNLTPEARNEFCQVIGEILINAEEHSTTSNRYSIGYFEKLPNQGNAPEKGIFNLVIFNFGKSIYEKFKDPSCPAINIVERMRELSSHYTERSFFHESFKEETLWTLYALQEGVTSIPDKKRGNGSIRFIDSFLKLKGIGDAKDEISKLTIISGNARITFDGSYNIHEVEKNGNKFNIMAFNRKNDIEEKPDKKFVNFVNNYFPGTMIVAKICISENDLVQQPPHETIHHQLERV